MSQKGGGEGPCRSPPPLWTPMRMDKVICKEVTYLSLLWMCFILFLIQFLDAEATPQQHNASFFPPPPLGSNHTCTAWSSTLHSYLFFFQPKNTTDDKTRGIHNQVDCIQGVPYNSCPVRAVLTHMNRDRARNIRYPVHKKDIIDTPHYCNKTWIYYIKMDVIWKLYSLKCTKNSV